MHTKNLDEIGLVTPYRKQVKESEYMDLGNIEKDTVHKYQGREKSVMIFSTVLDESVRSKFKMNFVNNPQMVNVAVSRAVNQLVVISNSNAFLKNGNHVGDLIKYIEYHDIKNLNEGRIVSVFDLLYKNYSKRLIKRKEAMNRVKKNIRFDSEKIIYSILEELISKEIFQCYSFVHEIRLADIFIDLERCNDEEKKFIRQPRTSVDFLVFNKFDNSPVLAIEVDGTQYHLNNPDQMVRDRKKDGIFKKYGIEMLRLATHSLVTEEIIENELVKLTQEQ